MSLLSISGYPILELMNMNVNFRDVYETKFLPALECQVEDAGGCPLIVCRNEPWKWRGVENPGSMCINQWPDWKSYERFYARGEFYIE